MSSTRKPDDRIGRYDTAVASGAVVSQVVPTREASVRLRPIGLVGSRIEGGLWAETMGSPVAAGLGSLCAFALGAFVPLLPFLIFAGTPAFVTSIAASGLALFALGMGVSRLTHRHPIWTGIRQAGLGGLAAAVTFGVGSLLGTAVH